MNILLVEDQTNYAFIVREMLHKEAVATVASVESLDQALDHLAQQTPELILLDLSLPDSHGLDTLIRLRRQSGEIPIIVLTGTADEQLAIEAVHRGAQDYLVKGEVDRRGLIRAIRYAMERRQQATHLENATQKVKQTEQQQRAILESIHAIVWESDIASRQIRFIGKGVESILGFPLESLSRECEFYLDLVHSDDRHWVSETFARHLKEGTDFEIEHRVIAADGRLVWVRQIVRILKNGDGTAVRLGGVTIDVSQSKAAEQALRERDIELRYLQESSQKLLDTEDVNEAVENILDLAMKLGNFDIGVLRLLSPTGKLRHVCYRGYRDPQAISVIEQPLTVGRSEGFGLLVVDVLKHRRSRVFENVDAVNELRTAKREGVRSAVLVPVATKNESLGVLFVGTRTAAKNDPAQVRLLEMLASHIGILVQKARLYEESRAQFGQLQTIRQFEQAMVSTLDLEDVLKVLLDDIEGFFPFPVALSVHLIDPDKQTIDYVTGRHFVGGNFTAGSSINQGLFGAVLRSPAPLEIAVLANDPRTTRLDLIRREGFVSCLAIALKLRQEAVGVLAVRTWHEHKFTASEIHYLNSVASHAAIALHNARLYAEREKRSQEFSALYAVTATASQSLEVDQILQQIVEKIAAVFGFDASGVFLFDGQNEQLILRSGHGGEPFEMAQAQSFKKGRGVVGNVAQSGKAIIFSDTRSDPRYQQMSETKIAARARHQFLAGFPINYNNETFGVVMCMSRNPRELSAHEIELIESMSNQIAVAVANSRLFAQTKDQAEQLRQLASHSETVREQERIRIARELHDELGQALTGLKFDVSWVHGKLAKTHPALCARLAEMSDSLDGAINATRKISTRLRPDILDKLGLAAAVEWQLQDFRKRTGIKYHFAAHPDELRLDEQQSTALFRILQEALTNVARHSRASRVRVALERRDTEVTLSIDDNGSGIENGKIFDARSLGLLGMRERAVSLGGNITIQRDGQRGTSVITRLPLVHLNENVETSPRSMEL